MAMVGAVGGGLAAVTMALSVAAVHIIHTVRVVRLYWCECGRRPRRRRITKSEICENTTEGYVYPLGFIIRTV